MACQKRIVIPPILKIPQPINGTWDKGDIDKQEEHEADHDVMMPIGAASFI